MPAAPRLVDWYRADPWAAMRRVLLIGPSVLTLGGLVIGLSFLVRVPRDLRADATLVGMGLIAGGVLFTMIAMNRLLRDDVTLALRTDGVALRVGGVETLVGWEDLTGARWDAARGMLILERGEEVEVTVARRFAGIGGRELAERILRARQKAALGLLR